MKLIYLEWEDACGESGWKHESEIKDWIKEATTLVQQTGWVISETKTHLVICSRKTPDHEAWEREYGHLQKIPKTWIRKKVDLTKHIWPKRKKKS